MPATVTPHPPIAPTNRNYHLRNTHTSDVDRATPTQPPSPAPTLQDPTTHPVTEPTVEPQPPRGSVNPTPTSPRLDNVSPHTHSLTQLAQPTTGFPLQHYALIPFRFFSQASNRYTTRLLRATATSPTLPSQARAPSPAMDAHPIRHPPGDDRTPPHAAPPTLHTAFTQLSTLFHHAPLTEDMTAHLPTPHRESSKLHTRHWHHTQ